MVCIFIGHIKNSNLVILSAVGILTIFYTRGALVYIGVMQYSKYIFARKQTPIQLVDVFMARTLTNHNHRFVIETPYIIKESKLFIH